VGVEAVAGEKLKLALSKSQAKRANKPAKKVSSTVMGAKSGRKVCKAVAADVAKFRPDLKARAGAAALRAGALQRKWRRRASHARARAALPTRTQQPPDPATHAAAAARRAPPCAAPPPSRRACA
jgi:hypothetical protein